MKYTHDCRDLLIYGPVLLRPTERKIISVEYPVLDLTFPERGEGSVLEGSGPHSIVQSRYLKGVVNKEEVRNAINGWSSARGNVTGGSEAGQHAKKSKLTVCFPFRDGTKM